MCQKIYRSNMDYRSDHVTHFTPIILIQTHLMNIIRSHDLQSGASADLHYHVSLQLV